MPIIHTKKSIAFKFKGKEPMEIRMLHDDYPFKFYEQTNVMNTFRTCFVSKRLVKHLLARALVKKVDYQVFQISKGVGKLHAAQIGAHQFSDKLTYYIVKEYHEGRVDFDEFVGFVNSTNECAIAAIIPELNIGLLVKT